MIALHATASGEGKRSRELEDQVVACNKGDWDSCLRAVAKLKNSDPVLAIGLYEKVCFNGDQRACSKLNKHMPGLIRAAKRACDSGQRRACLALARMHEFEFKFSALGGNLPILYAKAIAAVQKACELYDPDACGSLPIMLAKKLPMRLSACVKGDIDKCMQAADVLAYDAPAKAAALFEIACEAGNGEGCDGLGFMLSDPHYEGVLGGGLPQDETKAVSCYQKACSLGQLSGCHWAGMAYIEALGVGKNYTKAGQLFHTGCAGGNRRSCFNLAVMNRFGLGTKKDAVKSEALYKRACNGSFHDGTGKKGRLRVDRYFRTMCLDRHKFSDGPRWL